MSELSLLGNFPSETYVLYPDWHHDDESVDSNDADGGDGGDGGGDGDGDDGEDRDGGDGDDGEDRDGGGDDDNGSDGGGDDTMVVMMKLPHFTRLSSSLKQWVWLCLGC